MKRFLVVVLALVVFACFAVVNGSKVESMCGGYVSTPPVIKGLDAAKGVGDGVRKMVEGGPTPLEVYRFIRDTLDMVSLLWDEFRGASRGDGESSAATGWRNRVSEEQRRALASCCPTASAAPSGPDSPETETPYDPKLASISTRGATAFTAEQISIAATAARVASERGLPQQALVDVLAAGFVESGIRNLDYGDRDSLGWLQQRASWGSAAQRQDPAYAAGKFYDALVGVQGWQDLPLTVAVQRVQVSAFPTRYAAYEDEAEALAQQVGGVGPLTDAKTDAAVQSCGGTPNAAVATWNPCFCNDEADVLAGIRDLISKGADVIGLQEVPTAARRQAIAAAFPEFALVGMDSSTPVLVRSSRFTVVSHTTQLALRRHEPMEGPPQGARFVVSATLRDNDSSQTFSMVNTHMLPQVQKVGELNAAWPKRLAAYRRQLAMVTETAASLRSRGAVILVGDMNFDGDPDGAFGAAGFTASTATLGAISTRGDRDIDHVWASGATPASEVVLAAHGSDHRPKLVRFVAPSSAEVASAAGVASSPAAFNLPGQRTVDQAIQYLASMDGQRIPTGACLHYMAVAYGHQSTQMVAGHHYAVGQWDAMPAQYKHPGMGVPSRGALVFWNTSNVAGHIAISDGAGFVWTTDPPGHPGTIARVPISDIDRWGPRLGYSAPYFVGRTGGVQA